MEQANRESFIDHLELLLSDVDQLQNRKQNHTQILDRVRYRLEILFADDSKLRFSRSPSISDAISRLYLAVDASFTTEKKILEPENTRREQLERDKIKIMEIITNSSREIRSNMQSI